MSPTALVAHLISRQSAATLCLSVLGPQPVSTVEGFPTQGGRACLGAGLAVPHPASSRRWPSVRDPCGEPSLGLADPPLARRSPGCGASPVLALAPPRGDVAREAGTAAVAPDQGERSGNGSRRACVREVLVLAPPLGRPSLCLWVPAAREPDFSVIFRQPTRLQASLLSLSLCRCSSRS